jgi:hypothetical protein
MLACLYGLAIWDENFAAVAHLFACRARRNFMADEQAGFHSLGGGACAALIGRAYP